MIYHNWCIYGSEVIKMTKEEFKSIMEMIVLILEKSKDKEEALRDIKSLAILQDTDKKE